MQKNAIVAQQLYYSRYGKVMVRNGNLVVPEQEIYVLVGPDGCGKTSLVHLLSGMEKPQRGILALFGNPEPSMQEYRKIGTIFEKGGFYDTMSAKANLKMKALAFGNYKKELIQAALRITGLEKIARKRIKSYSNAEKVKLALAMAIIGSPKLLLVDEVLDGLSKEEKNDILRILKGFQKKYKMTILITSREMDSVQEIATWYGIMEKGSVISQFPAQELGNNQEEAEIPEEIQKAKKMKKRGKRL